MSKVGNRVKYERAGRRAEFLATWYLRFKGYKILTHRFKCHRGEIDIIARKADVLVVVEVKQRAERVSAEESLTYTLMSRVSEAVDVYVSRRREVQTLAVRYDAVFVIGRWKLYHLKDVWRN